MEEPKKETAAAAKPPPAVAAAAKKSEATAATATANKKKRNNSKPPAEGKAAKKKKKDTEGGTKKKKKATAVAPEPLTVNTSNIPVPAPAAAAATPTTTSTGSAAANLANKPLVDQVLFRLSEGIPRLELKSMVREADDCEKSLLQEIQVLEEALEREENAGADDASATAAPESNPEEEAKPADPNTKPAATPKAGEAAKNKEEFDKQVNTIMENPYTPLDRCFTLSALLGRLRDDLAVPSMRKPSPAAMAANTKKKKANSNPTPTYPQLVALADNPNYTRVHPDPPTQLLHVWRKIASHRTAMVFRRPVKPEEAPGYAERILFPMDLSLVRKMIVARILTSYSQVHQRIRLISHNCVKYNGRESDYGIVAREFEATVDEYMMAAVLQQVQQPAAATGKMPTPKASGRVSPKNAGGGSGRSSPKSVGGGSGGASPKTVGGGSGRNSPKTVSIPSPASIAAATAAAAAAVANAMAAAAPAPASTKPPAAPKTK